MFQKRKTIAIILIVSIILNSTLPAWAAPTYRPLQQGAVVDPATFYDKLLPGESKTFTLTVTTASTPIPKVDVLLLFDVTSSMNEEIDQAKAQGTAIMQQLQAQVADAAFGVGSFADYNGEFSSPGYSAEYGSETDYPWRLDQPITNDVALAQAAINGLVLQNGNDGPESYLRALWETLFIDWRPGAKHIIVLFGDAPAHDPDFYLARGGENYGIDPGPDEIIGTSDDLTMEGVIAQIADRGIEIIPVNCDTEGLSFIQAGFEEMAAQTGGQVYPLADAAELATVVAQSLTQSTSVINVMQVEPQPDYASWVAVTPANYTAVGGGEIRSFAVTISVPKGTPAGSYDFILSVTGDRATLGGSKVRVDVGPVGMSLDATVLLKQKRELATELSTLAYESEFVGITIPAITTSNYADEEKQVLAWLDTLDADNLSPGQLNALHRLVEQEKGLRDLWHAKARMVHVGNTQTAHMVGLVFSVVAVWKTLGTFLHKKLTGLLVTKLNNYILQKLASMATTVVQWALDGMPDGATKSLLKSASMTLGAGLEANLGNALKTTNYGKDVGQDFFEQIIASALVLPLDTITVQAYTAQTGATVLDGLSQAQNLSAMSIGLPQVEAMAPAVINAREAVIAPEMNTAQALEREKEDLEVKQHIMSLGADFAAVAGTALALTGIGSIAGTVGQLISLALKVVDGLMSANLAVQAYGHWYPFNAASALTSKTFAATAYGPFSDPQVYALGPKMKVQLLPPGRRMTPAMRAALAKVHTGVVTYNDLLSDLQAAVATNDQTKIDEISDRLLVLDADVSALLAGVRQAVATEAPEQLPTSPAYAAGYSDIGRSAAHFDGEGAKLYLDLLALQLEPDNSSLRQSTLTQIDTVKQRSTAYDEALQRTVPLLKHFDEQAIIIVSSYQWPETVLVGQSSQLVITVNNPSPVAANDVDITLVSNADQVQIAVPEQRLGSLAANTSQTIIFDITLLTDGALLSIQPALSNGSGAMRMIYLSASQAALPPSGGSSGALWVFVLGFAVLLFTVVVVVGNRRRRQRVGKGVNAYLRSAEGTRLRVWDSAVLGRSQTADIQLFDATVSRRHAQIRYADHQWFIYDLGSRSGTFVNEQPITASLLRPGDRVRFGAVTFIFET